MKVYNLAINDLYETLAIKDFGKDNIKFLGLEKLTDEWEDKTLKVSQKGKKSDIGFCINPMQNLLITKKAREILETHLENEDIELLPLNKGKDKYYILHGIKVYEMSHEYIKKGTKFYHQFDEKELIDLGIGDKLFFRGLFTNNVLSQLFYTEKFVELVKLYDLQGVDFEVVWDSESEP